MQKAIKIVTKAISSPCKLSVTHSTIVMPIKIIALRSFDESGVCSMSTSISTGSLS